MLAAFEHAIAELGRRRGLEWFLYLASAPRRLIKPYLVSNTAFIYYLLTGRL